MTTNLKHLIKHIHSRSLSVKLDKLPHKKLWIPNYGEFISFKNQADGDNWDVLIPGYPKLNTDLSYSSKNLLGVYYLPDENHKLIIDIFHEDYNRSENWVDDVVKYQKSYEKKNKIKGELLLNICYFNQK